jgi:SAM-dependent methyltransferase
MSLSSSNPARLGPPERVEVRYEDVPILSKCGFREEALTFLRKRVAHHFPAARIQFSELEKGRPLAEQTSDGPGTDWVIQVSLLNPLLDLELLQAMMRIAIGHGTPVVAVGAVPGTAPVLAGTRAGIRRDGSVPKECHWDTQRKHNSQLNLARLKRVKIFKSLCREFPNLHQLSVAEVLAFCASPAGVQLVIKYGEDVALQSYSRCPLCGSDRSFALHCDVNQPVGGFLTRDSEYYYLCQDCHLVYLNPSMAEEDLWRYYDTHAYEQAYSREELRALYSNLNVLTVSHYANYEAILPELRRLPPNARVLDLGGGMGEFCVFVKNGFPSYDVNLVDFRIHTEAVKELGDRGIHCINKNFTREAFEPESCDLITNWEVIEHLKPERLELYFRMVARALRPSGYYCFSTPDFGNSFSHSLDFWATAPGEHLTVLSRRVLEPILGRCGLRVVQEYHECVTMKAKGRWFAYGSQANSSLASRADAVIIENLLTDDALRESYQSLMRRRQLGSELILCLQKIGGGESP